jgi:hypothetical protein
MLRRLAVTAAFILSPGAAMAAAMAHHMFPVEVPATAEKRRNSDPLGARLMETKYSVQCVQWREQSAWASGCSRRKKVAAEAASAAGVESGGAADGGGGEALPAAAAATSAAAAAPSSPSTR